MVMNNILICIEKLEKREEERQFQAPMNEAYDKRINTLIYDLEENFESAWESRDETINVIHDFMKNGLNLEFNKFAFVNYHIFSQRPVFKDDGRVNCPVIIKLVSAADKC